MTLDKLRPLDKDHLLDVLGLETKRTMADIAVPALALFGIGVLIGTGLGLLVAPQPGKELRQDLVRRVQRAPEVIAARSRKVSDAMHHLGDRVSDTSGNGM